VTSAEALENEWARANSTDNSDGAGIDPTLEGQTQLDASLSDNSQWWSKNHESFTFSAVAAAGNQNVSGLMPTPGGELLLQHGYFGDPKLDLAWVVQTWPEDTTAGDGSVGGYVDMTDMPSRSEVLARYAEVSGRQVDDIDYYVILARWKLAIVLEQGYQRATDESPALRAFGPIVLDSMRAAAELAESTDYR
jgi:hypothetical protein